MANIMSRETKDGRFVRQANRFTDRIGAGEYPAEAGRYQLHASLACPPPRRGLEGETCTSSH
jgi:glutathionyl-hydroquinone reductase